MRYLVERTIPDLLGRKWVAGSDFGEEVVSQIKNPRTIRSMLSLGWIRELAEAGEVPAPRRGPGRPRKE